MQIPHLGAAEVQGVLHQVQPGRAAPGQPPGGGGQRRRRPGPPHPAEAALRAAPAHPGVAPLIGEHLPAPGGEDLRGLPVRLRGALEDHPRLGVRVDGGVPPADRLHRQRMGGDPGQCGAHRRLGAQPVHLVGGLPVPGGGDGVGQGEQQIGALGVMGHAQVHPVQVQRHLRGGGVHRLPGRAAVHPARVVAGAGRAGGAGPFPGAQRGGVALLRLRRGGGGAQQLQFRVEERGGEIGGGGAGAAFGQPPGVAQQHAAAPDSGEEVLHVHHGRPFPYCGDLREV
ncbi:hypothetical protein CSPHI_03030 [Corynebacterium sphenisci DSM 44792]|uniref:Uncharacterized protein n=1 Tax=Corynebacterium sphenisci DSM 44792 TaxID=1437874 RepID=A0A1L7CWI3_9CORY|nr:hypothetical protein CSPHI_03030 [Corynebacterium sphenisci DSM 44792]